MTREKMLEKMARNRQLTLLIYRLNHWENHYREGKKSALRYAGKSGQLRELARAILWRNNRRIMAELEKSAP